MWLKSINEQSLISLYRYDLFEKINKRTCSSIRNSKVLKMNPEFRIFGDFLIIWNLFRCMNDRLRKFDAFNPKISHFKVTWLKDSLKEWVILCSKITTFEPSFWRIGRARPHFSLPSYDESFNDLSKKVGLVLWFLKV